MSTTSMELRQAIQGNFYDKTQVGDICTDFNETFDTFDILIRFNKIA